MAADGRVRCGSDAEARVLVRAAQCGAVELDAVIKGVDGCKKV